ncbi:hypothetical protein F5Y15DRAFT_20636 [Xylariaceae sp. FL0016]|nr:hypothetical protein F5Y15DRAFT_20636 [Xylariaceae sp. FL0016]
MPTVPIVHEFSKISSEIQYVYRVRLVLPPGTSWSVLTVLGPLRCSASFPRLSFMALPPNCPSRPGRVKEAGQCHQRRHGPGHPLLPHCRIPFRYGGLQSVCASLVVCSRIGTQPSQASAPSIDLLPTPTMEACQTRACMGLSPSRFPPRMATTAIAGPRRPGFQYANATRVECSLPNPLWLPEPLAKVEDGSQSLAPAVNAHSRYLHSR